MSRPAAVSKQISLHIHTPTPACPQGSGQPPWNHVDVLSTQTHPQKRENSEQTITIQYVLGRVCPKPTTNGANPLFRNNTAMAKRNASSTPTPALVYLQGIHTRQRNMNSYMLRFYSKVMYVSSPYTQHTNLVFIRRTLHLLFGNAVHALDAPQQSSAHSRHRPNVPRHTHTHSRDQALERDALQNLGRHEWHGLRPEDCCHGGLAALPSEAMRDNRDNRPYHQHRILLRAVLRTPTHTLRCVTQALVQTVPRLQEMNCRQDLLQYKPSFDNSDNSPLLHLQVHTQADRLSQQSGAGLSSYVA